MAQQKISERLRTSLVIVRTQPSLGVKIWQYLNGGNWFTVYLFIFLFFAFTWSAANSGTPLELRVLNTFAAAAMLLMGGCVYFWTANRPRTEKLVYDLISVAETLEALSTVKQTRRMYKASKKTKVFVQMFYLVVFGAQVVYISFPLISGTNMGNIPTVDSYTFGFWITYVLVTYCFVTGTAVSSFLSYNAQMCLCLVSLLQTLKEQIRDVQVDGALVCLITIHQDLLKVAINFRNLCLRAFFVLMSSFTILLIANTSILITLSKDPGIMVMVAQNMGIIYCLCAFGEQIQRFSAEISEGAYEGAWIYQSLSFRRSVMFVIARCQTPCYLKAALIGKLEFRLFMTAIKLWYRFVQALLNLTARN